MNIHEVAGDYEKLAENLKDREALEVAYALKMER